MAELASWGAVRFFQIDLRDQVQHAALMKYTLQEFGALDLLVNNAKPPLRTGSESLDDWDDGMAVMVKVPALLSYLAVKHMPKGGSIVNIASTNAHYISHQPLVYHVAKAALLQLNRYLAREFGHIGVRVNAVSPELVDVPGRDFLKKEKNAQIIAQAVPLQRAAIPADIAGAICFLSSDEAAYINGQEIVLDGGLSLNDHFHIAYHAYDLKSQVGEKS